MIASAPRITPWHHTNPLTCGGVDRFLRDISGREELLTEFDEVLWLTVIDIVTVRKDGVLVFRFHDGREIEG